MEEIKIEAIELLEFPVDYKADMPVPIVWLSKDEIAALYQREDDNVGR